MKLAAGRQQATTIRICPRGSCKHGVGGLSTRCNHLQVFGMHECQAVPPAVRFRPERVQLLVKALLSGGVERGEGAIDGAVVKPEEVHNVRRRERVIQRVVSSSALELTYLRTESFSHNALIAPQQR